MGGEISSIQTHSDVQDKAIIALLYASLIHLVAEHSNLKSIQKDRASHFASI